MSRSNFWQSRSLLVWAAIGAALAASGCSKVDQQVDALGCALILGYMILCCVQFALPLIHRSPVFIQFREKAIPAARYASICVALIGGGAMIESWQNKQRFPTIAAGIPLLIMALATWIWLWSSVQIKEEQAKYAKLSTVTIAFLTALYILKEKGPRLF